MAYTALSISTSAVITKTMDITIEQNDLCCHSHYSKKLCTNSIDVQRSYSLSNYQICCFINCVQAISSMQPKLMSNKKKHRIWRNRTRKQDMDPDMMIGNSLTHEDEFGCDDENSCLVDYEEGDDEKEVVYDHDSLTKFLVHVPWSDAKLYSQLVFLCDMAYVIPQIKAMDLRRYCGIQFITSSLEKKAKLNEKLDQYSTPVPKDVSVASQDGAKIGKDDENKHQIQLVYDAAASATSFVQLSIKELLFLATKSMKKFGNEDSDGSGDSWREAAEGTSKVYKSEIAPYYAKSTMTLEVAAGEREKLMEAEKDLLLLHSSPFEWFMCDNSSNYTRLFVIQGLDSLASWQATLLFEPTKFEDTDALVHRGIYEAAKGIYEQIMPLIIEHLKRHGEYAKLQFTGHCIGGSISHLVHLMLLTRKVVIPSNLRPVVTFGSPSVFCGGQKLLDELGLDESHIHCVIMHRDIVPRIFSCNYPEHIALVLKYSNRSFQSHPCLMKMKVLYSQLGKIFILQPDQRTSPPHPLLPSGNSLYALDSTKSEYSPSVLRTFLNQPYPIETLIDPKAYGSEGTILRDHNSSNYLSAVNGVLRQHSKFLVRRVRKKKD